MRFNRWIQLLVGSSKTNQSISSFFKRFRTNIFIDTATRFEPLRVYFHQPLPLTTHKFTSENLDLKTSFKREETPSMRETNETVGQSASDPTHSAATDPHTTNTPVDPIPTPLKHIPTSQATTGNYIRDAVVLRYHDLERLFAAGGDRNTAFMIVGGLFLTATVYIFWEPIKYFFSTQGADVASQTLENEKLIQNATEGLKKVATDALKHPETLEELVVLSKNFLSKPETQIIVQTFLLSVLNDPKSLAMVSEFAGKLVQQLLADPTTRDSVTLLFRNVLMEPSFQETATLLVKHVLNTQSTRDSVIELLKFVFSDPVLRDQYAVVFFKDILATSAIQEQVNAVAKQAVHDVLNDQLIKQHVLTYLHDIVQNEDIKRDSSEAAWDVLMRTITPTWFSNKTFAEAKEELEQSRKKMAAFQHSQQAHSKQEQKINAEQLTKSGSSTPLPSSAFTKPEVHTTPRA